MALLLGGEGLSKGQSAPDPLAALARPGSQIIEGDRVYGDKVGGDKIQVGNISNSVVAVGSSRGAKAKKTTQD